MTAESRTRLGEIALVLVTAAIIGCIAVPYVVRSLAQKGMLQCWKCGEEQAIDLSDLTPYVRHADADTKGKRPRRP